MDLAQKVNRSKAIIDGMVVSAVNLVIFHDEHEVWFQIHLGLWLGKPTLTVLEKKERSFKEKLEAMGIQVFEVDEFTDDSAKQVADEIQKFVKEVVK